MNGFIEFISTPVATVLRGIHALLSTFLAPGSGPAWGLSIVLLVVVVRLLLFPIFIKQVKSQRRMQELAPQISELRKKHKGDRETLGAETMKLYKEHNANPISGCLPILLQAPVFFAVFSVMNEFRPGKDARFGLSAEQLAEGGQAKIFGAPIGSAFNSSTKLLEDFGANSLTVRVVCAVMVVLMGLSMFWTQKQLMIKNGPATDPQQAQMQKLLLYVFPFSFAISGFIFPVGVLLYQLVSNLWSMGQQHWVIARMPPVVPLGAAGKPTTKPAAKTPGKPARAGSALSAPERGPVGGGEAAGSQAAVGGSATGAPLLTAQRTQPGGPSARKQAGSRKNKSKKRGRR